MSAERCTAWREAHDVTYRLADRRSANKDELKIEWGNENVPMKIVRRLREEAPASLFAFHSNG